MSAKFLRISSNADFREKNLWFSFCKAQKIPFITISTLTDRATVEWDYITLPGECDRLIQQHKSRLLEGFRRIYEKYANIHSEARLSCHFPRFSSIEGAQAEALANELHDFISATLGLEHMQMELMTPIAPNVAPIALSAVSAAPQQENHRTRTKRIIQRKEGLSNLALSSA